MGFTGLNAQTTLAPGDLMIVNVNADDNDNFDFVPLVDLSVGTVISFTDCAWTGTALNTNEGTKTYTAAAAVAKGTVISFDGTVSETNGWTSSGSYALAASGDNLLAYQGASSAPTFIYGIGWAISSPWITTGTVANSNSYIPTGLSEAAKTIVSLGTSDNYQYDVTKGKTGTKSELLTLIANAANWVGNDATAYSAVVGLFTVNADVIPTTPTITVTEVSIPEMVTYAGENIVETINVSGINLTENIAMELSGTDAALFELNTVEVSQTDGTAASMEVSITYKPTAPGSHTATLTLSSADATDVVRTLTGTSTWKPLAVPVATDASASNASGFTANWDAVTDATEYQLDVVTKSLTPTADLFISEYAEGSSNNKYIEIYNGTGSSVDLSTYVVKQSNNGTGWPTDINASTYLPLTGTLASGDVYVLANSSADPIILALADVSIAYSSSVQGGTVLGFNGNDAVGLFKNDVLIDLFGDPAITTSFDVAGVAGASEEHTMVRKAVVSSGNTDWALSAGTDEASSEWAVSAQNTWIFLGAHDYAGLVATPITGSPFTVTETTKALTSLDAGTTYYYTVTAKNTTKGLTSAVSNEIPALTGTTSLVNPTIDLTVVAINGSIKFSALAGETVEVYNAIGQKLISKTTVDGINTIPVAARGVILVKVGTKISKVIM